MKFKIATICLIVFIWVLFSILAILDDTLFDWIYLIIAVFLSVFIYGYMREITYNRNTDTYWGE